MLENERDRLDTRFVSSWTRRKYGVSLSRRRKCRAPKHSQTNTPTSGGVVTATAARRDFMANAHDDIRLHPSTGLRSETSIGPNQVELSKWDWSIPSVRVLGQIFSTVDTRFHACAKIAPLAKGLAGGGSHGRTKIAELGGWDALCPRQESWKEHGNWWEWRPRPAAFSVVCGTLGTRVAWRTIFLRKFQIPSYIYVKCVNYVTFGCGNRKIFSRSRVHLEMRERYLSSVAIWFALRVSLRACSGLKTYLEISGNRACELTVPSRRVQTVRFCICNVWISTMWSFLLVLHTLEIVVT